MSVLLIVEHNGAVLTPATYAAVTAAQQLKLELTLMLLGHDLSQIAKQVQLINGVDKVLVVDSPELKYQFAEDVAAQVLAIAKQYSHIVFTASAIGKSAAPRVAAKLDVAQISDVMQIISADEFVRPMYTGNVLAHVKSLDNIKVLTIRTTSFVGGKRQQTMASVEQLALVLNAVKPKFLDYLASNNERPELTSAEIIVAGGRGIGGEFEFKKLLLPLADKLKAAVGASRAAVDAGFAPNDWQVGQTGKIVAPKLYIAIGISGAIQHLAGMKESKIIVAINDDADAPIFQIADYGLVADLHNAIPELISLLS